MRLPLFIRQKVYEQIVFKVRRSLFTLLPTVFGFLVLLTLPLVVRWLLGALFPGILDQPLIYPLAVLFASLYYLAVNLFFYSYFIDFYLDLLVVTNDRLIDIEQVGLFSRTVSEIDLYQVQDIISQVTGFVPSLLNYGTLTIQMAGPLGQVVVRDVPNPNGLRRAILDLAEKDRQHHS